MSTPSSAGLAGHISASDPSSADEQREILERIARFRNQVPASSRGDVTAHLDLAATLTNYLVRFGGLGPRDVLEIISGLVGEVESTISETPAAARPGAKHVQLSAPTSTGSLQLMSHDSAKNKSTLLGEILVRLGTITREQLEQACKMHHASGVRFGETLVSMGATDWDGITKGLGIQKQITGHK